MNKKILSILLALILMGLLVGCGGANTESHSNGNSMTTSSEPSKK